LITAQEATGLNPVEVTNVYKGFKRLKPFLFLALAHDLPTICELTIFKHKKTFQVKGLIIIYFQSQYFASILSTSFFKSGIFQYFNFKKAIVSQNVFFTILLVIARLNKVF